MRSELLFLALFASTALAQPMVGAGVGNADTFVSEGSKLFNKKQYAKASEQFLKATRVNPPLVQTYVQLARAQLLAKELQRACYAYRVYLKSVPDGPDRKKASSESDQCERQVKGRKKPPEDPRQQAWAYAYLAWAYYGLDRTADARSAADSARRADPGIVSRLAVLPSPVASLFK